MGAKPPISLTILGGGGEVGASCFQLMVNGQHILLDCGTHPKKDGRESLPQFDLLRSAPQALLVSHGHIDHCGSVPYLLKEFPLCRVHTTIPTMGIMDRMLHNSVSVMETLARERGIEDYPLFDHADVGYATRMVEAHALDTEVTLPLDPPVNVRFLHAGHVLGSSSVLVKTEGHTLYYTADVCACDQELMGRYHRLRGEEVDTLVIESTRGATDDSKVRSYEEEARRFGEAIRDVLDGGGVALVPVFALGRMQEVVNMISRMQEEGLIPAVPVYASGLGRAVYELYNKHMEYLRPDATLRPLDYYGRVGNVYTTQGVKDLLSEPAIICATSGMMVENTPSAMIAQELITEKRHAIFFCGYLDHETLGYKVLHSEPGTPLQFARGAQPVPRVCENIRRFDFSAHAPREDLRALASALHPRNIVYVHGDPDALAWMEANTGNGAANRIAPRIGQTVSLGP